MSNLFRNTCLGIAVLVGLSSAGANPTAASRAQKKHLRLDASLQSAVDEGSNDAQRVIIRVRPDARTTVRGALAAHGDQILAEHDSIDAITAVVHSEDLETLGSADTVLSISRDAVVRPHGLLGLVGGIVGGLVNVVTDVVGILLP